MTKCKLFLTCHRVASHLTCHPSKSLTLLPTLLQQVGELIRNFKPRKKSLRSLVGRSSFPFPSPSRGKNSPHSHNRLSSALKQVPQSCTLVLQICGKPFYPGGEQRSKKNVNVINYSTETISICTIRTVRRSFVLSPRSPSHRYLRRRFLPFFM